ncbi:MarR family winged helix-turn-helix transcriptional regulator [Sulfitobacter sp.]|uniref:MarR family winged helix-turn-helix transcriptional regulator n=1 Tax=Sulfitobacter sp. TaxID=1903071 RepID=UPI003568C9F5
MTLDTMPGHLIRRLHQISTSVFAERMKAAGIDITSVQFAALTVLHEKPGIDQATLAQEIAYDRATIGGVVDRLERKGWVLRKVNQDDRRARQVTLTEEGTEMLAVVAPIVATLQADILAQLTLTERTAFIALASKAVAH